MILGTGVDIIEIARIKRSIDRYGKHFINRIFTPAEIAYCSTKTTAIIHYAARFAAKEAVSKALGTGFQQGVGWRDIEVIHNDLGKPSIQLADHLNLQFSYPQILISLSHSKENAIAFALWQQEPL